MIGESLGPYRIVSALGSGGMGEVYLAEDTRLGRKVAIKVLPPSMSGDAARLARFEQEARATSALNHPGICTLYDVGDHDGQPFLVMEALDGTTLKEVIDGEPLETGKLLDIAVQVADALSEAHDSGVLHRDLKAANIFVTAAGRTKILDFGLAKLTTSLSVDEMISAVPTVLAGDQKLTRDGTTLGTVSYMSPEQARGESLDARSDLFSFGVVLYEMATGSLPFKGTTQAVVFDQIFNQDPPSPISVNPRLPTGLVQLIDKALHKQPADRFTSAREMAAALEEIKRAPGSLDSIIPAAPPRASRWTAPPIDELPSPEPAGDLAPAPATTQPPSLTDSSPGRPSIAVLPFESMSADPEDEFFADGLSEEIINALTHLDGLDVAARTSAFSFKGKRQDIREIGAALDVTAVLEGSVRRAGNRLRITAQLIKVADGYHLWSERYDREMEDIFAIQDEITAAIVDVLQVRLIGGTEPAAREHGTSNMEAYDLYLRGRHFWRLRAPAAMFKAKEYFQRAIGLDPGYAAAYAGLADAYCVLGGVQIIPPQEALTNLQPAIDKALALNPSLAEAHHSQGFAKTWFTNDWPNALTHYERSLELNPSDPHVRAYYSMVLAMCRRSDEATSQGHEAIRRDPLSVFTHTAAGLTNYINGQFEDSIVVLEKGIEIDPNSAVSLWTMAWNYRMTGRLDEAIDWAEASAKITGRLPTYLGNLGYMYAAAGRTEDAREIIEEFRRREAEGEYVTPFGPLFVYTGLRDEAGMAASITRLVDQHEGGAPVLYGSIRWDLEELRDHPRLGPIIERLGLWPPEITG